MASDTDNSTAWGLRTYIRMPPSHASTVWPRGEVYERVGQELSEARKATDRGTSGGVRPISTNHKTNLVHQTVQFLSTIPPPLITCRYVALTEAHTLQVNLVTQPLQIRV